MGKCMHSKLFSFLIVMSKLSSRRRESRVFLREEKSFIISRKLGLSCCTFRYVDGVEEEQKSMESCTKMMSFVFKSFRRNNQSFVANLEVFQEKSFIILIVRKFSMESLMIGHEIHKKLLLSRCWDSNGENVNISQIEVTFIIENLPTKITYSRCLSQLCLSLCKKLKSFKEKKKSFVNENQVFRIKTILLWFGSGKIPEWFILVFR